MSHPKSEYEGSDTAASDSELSLLSEAVVLFNSGLQPETLLQGLVDYGCRLVGADGGGYAVHDGVGTQAGCKVAGVWQSSPSFKTLPRSWVTNRAKEQLGRDTAACSLHGELDSPVTCSSHLRLPLQLPTQDRLCGFVELCRRQGGELFNRHDLLLLRVLAVSAAAALASFYSERDTAPAVGDFDRGSGQLHRSQRFANIGTWDWDIESGALYWSECIGPLFGYPPGDQETTYDRFINAVHVDDRARVERAVKACIEGGEPYRIEHRVVWPDGTVRWVLERGDIQRSRSGAPQHMLGVVQDITERKQIEEALRKERDFAEALINTAQMIVLVLDTQGRIVRFNPYLEQLSGYALEEAKGKVWHECFLPLEKPENVERLFQSAQEVIRKQGQIAPLFTKSGELREIDWRYKTLRDEEGHMIGILATGHEITQRLETENALRESEERFRGLVESTNDWIWEVNEQGEYTYVSPQVEKILGYPPESLIGRRPFDLMSPQEGRRIEKEFLLLVSRLQPISRLENLNLDTRGREVMLETSGVPFFDSQGRFRGYRGIDRDISGRKRAERALREQTLRNRLILENSHDGFIVLNMDATLREVNDAYSTLVGYERHELARMKISDLDVGATEEAIAGRLETITAYGHDQFETSHRCKDGTLVDLDISTTLAKVGDDQFMFAFCRDITERRQREKRRLQEVREQRDTLVREIHHRIKNHLQGVINLLRIHSRDRPELADAMESAISQVDSIALVHGLQSRLDGAPIDLTELLEVIAGAIKPFSGMPLDTCNNTVDCGLVLRSSDAVPVALIINELLQNAVKHSPQESPRSEVLVALSLEQDAVRLEISNPCTTPLPKGFDVSQRRGLGTGLTLAADLLPTQGAHLEIAQIEGRVITRLELKPPVVNVE